MLYRGLSGFAVVVGFAFVLFGCGEDEQPQENNANQQVDEGNWEFPAVGSDHSCGIMTDGTIWCWGRGPLDLENPGDRITTETPIQFGSDSDWVELSVAGDNHCGLKTDGSAWCWGNNSGGQLGDGTSSSSYVPVEPISELDWNYIGATRSSTCGIKEDDTLWCWGSNYEGKLGIGSQELWYDTPQQVGDSGDWLMVSAGDGHACGIRTDNTLWCWGSNEQGRLGQGNQDEEDSSLVPVQVGTDSDWVDLSVGEHSCAIRENGSLWCWGDNHGGQLGDGTTEDRSLPVRTVAEAQWIEIAVSHRHSCGIQDDGSLWCWGRNTYGQLGTPEDGLQYAEPTRVDIDREFVTVATGPENTCTVTDQGALYCWGSNDHGQVGDGTTEERLSPSRVVDP